MFHVVVVLHQDFDKQSRTLCRGCGSLVWGSCDVGLIGQGVLAVLDHGGTRVGSIALANGWLSGDWLVIIALALTMTFVVAAPLNARARGVFSVLESRINRFETPDPLAEDCPIDPGSARIAIIGMARFGTGAYDTLKAKYGDVLIGIDADPDVVARHQSAGRNVILADATDDDFWYRVRGAATVDVTILAMPEHEQNLAVARGLQASKEEGGNDFAVVDYPEQAEALEALGVDETWNFDTEAGTAFAAEVISRLGDNLGETNSR